MNWPIMWRKTHSLDMRELRDVVDSEKARLRTEMEERLSDAVDSLPERQMALDALINIMVKARVDDTMAFLNDTVTIHAITEIPRELATGDMAMNAILARQLGGALRNYIEQEKNVNVPALIADAYGG